MAGRSDIRLLGLRREHDDEPHGEVLPEVAASMNVRKLFRAIIFRRLSDVQGLAVLVAIAGLVCWWFWAFPLQINNSIILQRYARRLDNLRKAQGAFPDHFEGTDYWGRPLRYFTDGQHFALVSYGRDGEPDRSYGANILASTPERETVCLRPNRDTVFRETGPVVYCLE